MQGNQREHQQRYAQRRNIANLREEGGNARNLRIQHDSRKRKKENRLKHLIQVNERFRKGGFIFKIKERYYLPNEVMKHIPRWAMDGIFTRDGHLSSLYWLPSTEQFDAVEKEYKYDKSKFSMRIPCYTATTIIHALLARYYLGGYKILPLHGAATTSWIYYTLLILDGMFQRAQIYTNHRIRDRLIPSIFNIVENNFTLTESAVYLINMYNTAIDSVQSEDAADFTVHAVRNNQNYVDIEFQHELIAQARNFRADEHVKIYDFAGLDFKDIREGLKSKGAVSRLRLSFFVHISKQRASREEFGIHLLLLRTAFTNQRLLAGLELPDPQEVPFLNTILSTDISEGYATRNLLEMFQGQQPMLGSTMATLSPMLLVRRCGLELGINPNDFTPENVPGQEVDAEYRHYSLVFRAELLTTTPLTSAALATKSAHAQRDNLQQTRRVNRNLEDGLDIYEAEAAPPPLNVANNRYRYQEIERIPGLRLAAAAHLNRINNLLEIHVENSSDDGENEGEAMNQENIQQELPALEAEENHFLPVELRRRLPNYIRREHGFNDLAIPAQLRLNIHNRNLAEYIADRERRNRGGGNAVQQDQRNPNPINNLGAVGVGNAPRGADVGIGNAINRLEGGGNVADNDRDEQQASDQSGGDNVADHSSVHSRNDNEGSFGARDAVDDVNNPNLNVAPVIQANIRNPLPQQQLRLVDRIYPRRGRIVHEAARESMYMRLRKNKGDDEEKRVHRRGGRGSRGMYVKSPLKRDVPKKTPLKHQDTPEDKMNKSSSLQLSSGGEDVDPNFLQSKENTGKEMSGDDEEISSEGVDSFASAMEEKLAELCKKAQKKPDNDILNSRIELMGNLLETRYSLLGDLKQLKSRKNQEGILELEQRLENNKNELRKIFVDTEEITKTTQEPMKTEKLPKKDIAAQERMSEEPEISKPATEKIQQPEDTRQEPEMRDNTEPILEGEKEYIKEQLDLLDLEQYAASTGICDKSEAGSISTAISPIHRQICHLDKINELLHMSKTAHSNAHLLESERYNSVIRNVLGERIFKNHSKIPGIFPDIEIVLQYNGHHFLGTKNLDLVEDDSAKNKKITIPHPSKIANLLGTFIFAKESFFNKNKDRLISTFLFSEDSVFSRSKLKEAYKYIKLKPTKDSSVLRRMVSSDMLGAIYSIFKSVSVYGYHSKTNMNIMYLSYTAYSIGHIFNIRDEAFTPISVLLGFIRCIDLLIAECLELIKDNVVMTINISAVFQAITNMRNLNFHHDLQKIMLNLKYPYIPIKGEKMYDEIVPQLKEKRDQIHEFYNSTTDKSLNSCRMKFEQTFKELTTDRKSNLNDVERLGLCCFTFFTCFKKCLMFKEGDTRRYDKEICAIPEEFPKHEFPDMLDEAIIDKLLADGIEFKHQNIVSRNKIWEDLGNK